MENSKEIKLPSGNVVRITLPPFEQSLALLDACMEEMKSVKLDSNADLLDPEIIKNVICYGLSSKKVRECMKVCMQRVTYNDLKIDADTFEPSSAREDYFDVCFIVIKENILPFGKRLYARYSQFQEMMQKSQE